MQRHVTSVFSEYQTMDNNSANSKQLQYWLKQISNPISSPNLGFQWTFMSNQSSHIQRNSRHNQPINQHSDQLSFGKTVHSSIDRDKDKENNSLVSNANSNHNSNTNSNSNNIHNQQNQVMQNKSKSYVNAMLALQKKVKTLQDQNTFIRKNLNKLNQQRNKSLSQSSLAQQQLKSRLKILQPKLIKIDELIEQNKSLRQTKDQKIRKIKLLQKNYQQIKNKYQQLYNNYQIITKQNYQYQQQLQKNKKSIKQLQLQLKKLYEKNKILQDMKQKSTINILQKYNKSIQHMQYLQKQNIKLKNQISYLKNKLNQDIKNIQQNHSKQIKKCHIQFEKLKQNLYLKQSVIQQKKKQVQYFKEAYQKKDQQFIELVKSQHKIIQQQQNQKIKEKEKQRQKQKQKEKEKERQKQYLKIPQLQKIKQNQKFQVRSQQKDKLKIKIQPNKQSKQSSIVQMPQTLIPGPSPRNKKSFDGFDSQEQDQFDESAIPVPTQTKSVGKPIKKLRSQQRKGNLSSQSRKAESKRSKNEENKVHNHNLCSPKTKQHKKIMKKKKNVQKQDASFTMKSCDPPKSQPMHKITFEGDFGSQERDNRQYKIANSYYYNTQYPPLPNSSYRLVNGSQEDIQEFYCKHNASHHSIDEAMLIQLQKQLLQLYEQQQNLILASNDEYATQAQRSQYVGRLKQINQHLRIKNQKICDLKSKI